jgi:RNA polymerase sigma-70 factor (ECF subfamily)
MEDSFIREFERFFKDNENVLYRIVRGFTESGDLAKDIVLETMMALYERWKKVRNFENKTGYAVRIAINKAKKKYLLKKASGWLLFLPDDELISKESGANNPELIAVRGEQEEWLAREIDKLRVDERRIILYKDIDKLKFEEISILLKLKLPTVKSIYRRGKLKLAKNREAKYA